MEEKLYFKPADYGAGRKKEKPEKKSHKGLKLAIFLFFIAAIVIVVLWLLRGKTTISGQFPANARSESLECVSSNIVYEKVNHINSDDKELKISAVFNGTESLSSISLKYTLNYASREEVVAAESRSHAQFGLALQDLGYTIEKFNNKFTMLDNSLVITLVINSRSEIDEVTRSYFLINEGANGSVPTTLAEYRVNYEKQGFSCNATNDKK